MFQINKYVKKIVLCSFSPRKLILIVVFLLYFIPGVFTLSDYNVNWDSPVHYIRGQAYLRYFLSGETNYRGLPQYHEFELAQNNKLIDKSKLPRYSIYQSESLNGEYFLKNDAGHPPLSGILAAFTNYIFYQKLGIMGDVNSYHMFILFLSALVAVLVFHWAQQEFGFFAAVISFLTITTYPLFIAESHNNIKDPVQTFFFTVSLYCFYKGIKFFSWQYILYSSIAAGFAFGTKFNIVFLPFILGVWIVFLMVKQRKEIFGNVFSIRKRFPFFCSLVVFPCIMFLILLVGWPYLWNDPLHNFLKIIEYYTTIGIGSNTQADYSVIGLNTYASLWILYASPYITIFLTILGIIFSILALFRKKHSYVLSLWLLWLAIPIMRVSIPGSSIYGGVRQIMEFVPAMALLAGFGAMIIKRIVGKNKIFLYCFLIFLAGGYSYTFLQITRIHPNENLYFNGFIGGLKGAAEKNLPGWAATLGNPYMQGVTWLNSHAEKNSVLTLALGTMTNIPKPVLRKDIEFANNLESLTRRKGEYIIGLSFLEFALPYDAQYPERFLIPIYEKIVEGVTILKIWKNDEAHTKPGFMKEKDVTEITNILITDNDFFIDLPEKLYVTRLEFNVDNERCMAVRSGSIYTSLDGQIWIRETEGLLDEQDPNMTKFKDNKITHFLAAVPAQKIKISIVHIHGCSMKDYAVKIFTLKDIKPS